MREAAPATRTMKISDVKRTLSRLVNEVYRGETRVLIEKAGIPVAALVSARDLERLTQLEGEKAARKKAIEAISVAFEGVPLEEIERETARAVAEARAEIAAEREIAAEDRNERFAVIDQMREAFKDVPPEEIERDVVAIIRQMRDAREAAIRSEEQATVERRPA